MKKITVAIDGYSSCGKSTIAKELARRAGYKYVDTGAMYRAVALYFLRFNDNIHNNPLVASLELTHRDKECIIEQLNNIHISFLPTSDGQHTLLNGEDVEKEIRTLAVGNMASQVSTIKEVRAFLVAAQQAMGAEGGIVMDGRDIGTVVFPNAELKLFLTASPEERAKRRFLELQSKGEHPVYEEVLHDVQERDYRDTHRKESPLRQAEDAIAVDNSDLTREEQMDIIMHLFEDHINI